MEQIPEQQKNRKRNFKAYFFNLTYFTFNVIINAYIYHFNLIYSLL